MRQRRGDRLSGAIDRRSDMSVAAAVAGEEKLFESRRTARIGQRAQLRERIAQLNEQFAARIRPSRRRLIIQVGVALPAEDVDAPEDFRLAPGMPTGFFIQTHERGPLQ